MGEYIGNAKAHGPDGVHTFEVWRAHGYTVTLDGKVIVTGTTHTMAWTTIARTAEERGWRRAA